MTTARIILSVGIALTGLMWIGLAGIQVLHAESPVFFIVGFLLTILLLLALLLRHRVLKFLGIGIGVFPLLMSVFRIATEHAQSAAPIPVWVLFMTIIMIYFATSVICFLDLRRVLQP
jgi:hypothetical protein